eukprot:766259-Hanusia_phi.AAC.3
MLGAGESRSCSSLAEEARATWLALTQSHVSCFPSRADRRDPAGPAVLMSEDPRAGDIPHRLVHGGVRSSRPPARVHELVHLLVEEVHPRGEEVDVAVDSRELLPAVAPGVDVGKPRLVDLLVVLELVGLWQPQHDRNFLFKAAEIVVGGVPSKQVVPSLDDLVVALIHGRVAVSHLHDRDGEVEEEGKLHVHVHFVLGHQGDTEGQVA